MRTLRVRMILDSSVRKSVNFFNEIKHSSLNTSFTPSLGVKFSWKDLFEIDPRYSISITKSDFDIDQFVDQNFVRHSLRLRTKTMVAKKLEWQNEIRYLYNS